MNRLALRFAVRNLLRHRRRTAVIGLGVALGAAAVVVQSDLVAGVRRQMTDHLVVSQFGHVTVSPEAPEGEEPSAPPLITDPHLLVRSIEEAVPGVEVAPGLTALGMAFGEIAGTARIALWGIVPEREKVLAAGLSRRMAGAAAPLARGSVYLGSRLAERLEVDRGDPVTLSVMSPEGELDAVDFGVAAVLGRGAPWEDYFVYLPLADLQDLMGVGESVGMLKLHLAEGLPGAGPVSERLGALLARDGAPVTVEPYGEKGRLYMGIIRASRIQAAIINFILLVAVALAVAGALVLSVHERIREIGTMAALGTPAALIRRVFLAEGLLLALLAGVAGAVVGVAVTLVLARSGIGMSAEAFAWMVGGPRIVPRIDPDAVAVMLVELLLVVGLSALYPAARAARQVPIEALRGGAS